MKNKIHNQLKECYLPGWDFKTENNCGFENIILKAKSGKLCQNDDEEVINNIKVMVDNDILIQFTSNISINNEEYDIRFYSEDGWFVELNKCYWSKKSDIIIMSCLKLNCDKGERGYQLINHWCLIENLPIYNNILNFEINDFKNLKLVKSKHDFFPNVEGYFNINGVPLIESYEIFDNLYYLLKLYSAGTSNLRIRYSCSQNGEHCKFNVSVHDLDFKINHNSFFDVGGDNLLKFIKSTYEQYLFAKQEDIVHIKTIIHYTSLLVNNSDDRDILAGFVLLELYASKYDFIKDENKITLKNKLSFLLKKLSIDETKLNDYFKQHVEFPQQTFLNFIVKSRDKMFHAQEIGYGNLRDVLKTFLIVLMIKTLKIECELYLPLENKVINTRNFLEQFHSLNSEDNELYDFDEVKIVKFDDDQFYLPLEFLDELNVDWSDGKYKVVSFKSLKNDGTCKQQIKFNKVK